MPLIEGCKYYLEITVPVEDVVAETTRVIEKISKQARLPGFRPGKVPQTLIRSRFAPEIKQDVLESLIPKALQKKVVEEKLEQVSAANYSELKFEEGEPLAFKAEFEIAPTFELGQYKGIAVVYKEPEVSEEDITKRVDTLREQKADYINIDPRPAEDGDFALLSLESLSGTEPAVNEKEIQLEIGHADTFPPFSDNLRGMTPGESKEFEVVYPEDYGTDRLAGKTVVFKASLNTLRKKELPELSDEFAQDLGDFKTVDELKDAVRKSILAERENGAQNEAKAKIMDVLVENHQFAVPQTYVDKQVENIVETRMREFSRQGVDVSKLNLDWTKVRDQHTEQANKDVRASLLLDRIATAEKLEATNEEIDREVQSVARRERESVAVVRRRLEKEGALTRIANHYRTEKTLSLLFDQATKSSE